MLETKNIYRVFISYSWTTIDHEEWVLDLATRLRENGVDVILDKWDLKEGHDKYKFMETMVTDKTIDRVLIICEKGYKKKADSRVGGAGTETQIIVPEVYNKTKQDKFIPIIKETGDEFESFVPAYMKGKIAINLSSEEKFESEYERLLRLIYKRPLYRKPTLGVTPSFLFEDKKPHYKTKNIVKSMRDKIYNHPEKIHFFISDFIDVLKEELRGCPLTQEDINTEGDEKIYCTIHELKDLRDDYVSFLSIIKKSKIDFDIDVIKRLFEELYEFTEFQGSGRYNSLQFDHYKFLITEMYLYTIGILLENKSYNDIYYLTNTAYFFKSKYSMKQEQENFKRLRFYIESLEEVRKNRLNSNLISVTAQILIERAVIGNKNYKDLILDADLLLHHISNIQNLEWSSWYPVTFVYRADKKIDFLQRMASKKNFEESKKVFGIDSKEEMIKIINNYKYEHIRAAHYTIPHINHHISEKDICKSV